MLDDEIEMESTGGVGGVAQISDEMEIDDVDSEDDNFENVSSVEEGYQSGCDERDEFTFQINVDEELIKYAKDFKCSGYKMNDLVVKNLYENINMILH